ncbi:Alpha/Beta hydrolase protein [Bombardia bombarda]|uniref:feruloyl esterase n=1 Tax=Bombardia bombarda TaxID=252184 RepID=A0AA39XB41_9PEZI|nr:Alpha/Beta hydrolase protein [Bombardia bombarda]
MMLISLTTAKAALGALVGGLVTLRASTDRQEVQTHPELTRLSQRERKLTSPSPQVDNCSRKAAVVVNTVSNQTIGDRTYKVFIPPSYSNTRATPVILSYHGGTKTADDQLALDLLTTAFFNTEYIVVYPYGVNKTWQGVPHVTTDDLAFTAAILDQLQHDYCVDASRIFATGKSQGGGFVGQHLACDPTLSQRIAAFAPVSGAFYIDDEECSSPSTIEIKPCSPGRDDVPMLEFHGGADDTIPYFGGPRRGACLPGIPHWIEAWAGRDGLDGGMNKSWALTGEATVYTFGDRDGDGDGDGEEGGLGWWRMCMMGMRWDMTGRRR